MKFINARILYALEPKILQQKGMDPKPQARFRYKASCYNSDVWFWM